MNELSIESVSLNECGFIMETALPTVEHIIISNRAERPIYFRSDLFQHVNTPLTDEIMYSELLVSHTYDALCRVHASFAYGTWQPDGENPTRYYEAE